MCVIDYIKEFEPAKYKIAECEQQTFCLHAIFSLVTKYCKNGLLRCYDLR